MRYASSMLIMNGCVFTDEDALMSKRPMNIVFITTDQMRADSLACVGNPIARTPNLDRLAAEGALAERVYVAQPLCMPSRSTIITGMTPRAHGVWTNGIPLDPEIPTVGDMLSAAGYRTALFGKAHFDFRITGCYLAVFPTQ